MVDKVRETIGEITLTGTANEDTTVSILIRDAAGDALLATCTTVPNLRPGYAAGCLLIDTNATGAARLLVNGSTNASCSFAPVA